MKGLGLDEHVERFVTNQSIRLISVLSVVNRLRLTSHRSSVATEAVEIRLGYGKIERPKRLATCSTA